MKSNLYKLSLITLCLCMAMVSCGNDNTDGDNSDAVTTEAAIIDTSDVTTDPTANESIDTTNPVRLKVGSYEVYQDEYDYYYLNYKFELDGGDETFWENNAAAEELLNQYVTGALRSNYAIHELAKQNGIVIDDADLSDIDKTVKEMETYYGGADMLASVFESYALTERCYREILKTSILESKLYTHYSINGMITPSEEDVLNDLNSNYVRAQHILITNDEGDDTAANRALADDILSRANAGEDFYSLVEAYGEDPGMEGNPDGYYFTYNQMIPEFEAAAFALKEGEISSVIEVSSYYSGYHIIKRLPMEESYINEHIEEFQSALMTTMFYQILEETAQTFEITLTK